MFLILVLTNIVVVVVDKKQKNAISQTDIRCF
jgi:hypothetical protein